jgi:2-iminobutanoate/2-iminopropanoate deaminase
MKKSFVRGTWQVKRAFSPAVITEGAGRTIFIAGHTGQTDDAGKSLAGDFDAQFKQTFRNIEKTLAEAGAKLSDMVTMTVFLIDARYTTRMTELRTELSRKRRDHRARLRPAGDDDRGAGDRGDGLEAQGAPAPLKRSHLQARPLRPADEEVFQDIFAVASGERLFANLAMQRQIARARRRFGAHELIACLAPRADEIGNIGFDHGATCVRAWVGFL